MFRFISLFGIFSGYVLTSSLELPSSSRCEMKLICAVAKSVGGNLSHLWDSELMRGVKPFYDEGRNSTDTLKTEIYHAVTTGTFEWSNTACLML